MNRRLDVLRSVTLVSLSTYVEYALGLLISIWIARTLGPADFGRYAFTVWLCSWLMTCSNHALTTSSTKFIAEADGAGQPSVASAIAYRLSRMQLLSSSIVALLFTLVTWIVRPDEWTSFLLPVTVLVIVAVVAKANFAMWVAISKGQERFEPVSIATVLAGVLGVVLVGLASYVHAGLVAFIGLFAVACLVLNLLNRLAFRHYCQPFAKGPIPPATGQRLSRHLRLTAALVLLISLKSSTIEVFLLNTFADSTAVGFFAIAATLTRGAVELFSVGLTTTLLPYMAKTFGQHGQQQAARLLAESTRFYWATGLAIAGIGVVTTPGIVALMYGQRYLAAIPAIEVTLVLAGLLLIGNSIAAFQIVVDRQDDRVRIALWALLANAVLGIALVPRFGLAGAVFTYAGTRFTELGLAIVYLRKITRGGLPLLPMLRLLLVGVLATALAWLVTAWWPQPLTFIAGALVFVGVFAPASFLVRFWSSEDLQLMGIIGNRLGPAGRWMVRGLQFLQGPMVRPR